MGRYSKAFSIKKQFQSSNCQTCQGQSRTLKKIVFPELFLRIIEDEKWNLFEKLCQLRTPNNHLNDLKLLFLLLYQKAICLIGDHVINLNQLLDPLILHYNTMQCQYVYVQFIVVLAYQQHCIVTNIHKVVTKVDFPFALI